MLRRHLGVAAFGVTIAVFSMAASLLFTAPDATAERGPGAPGA